MIKQVYLLNEDNILKDTVLYNSDNNTYYNENFEWVELNIDYTEITPPLANKVKFENGKWIIIEPFSLE